MLASRRGKTLIFIAIRGYQRRKLPQLSAIASSIANRPKKSEKPDWKRGTQFALVRSSKDGELKWLYIRAQASAGHLPANANGHPMIGIYTA
jgi:hypothetical protein